MKGIHKILDRFGYLLINKEYHRSKFMRKNEIRTLEQVFSRNYHRGYKVLLVGDEERFRNEPVFQLLKNEEYTLEVIDNLPELAKKLKHKERESAVDLLVINADSSIDSQLDDPLIPILNPGILILDHAYSDKPGAEKVVFRLLQLLLPYQYKIFIHNYDLIAYH